MINAAKESLSRQEHATMGHQINASETIQKEALNVTFQAASHLENGRMKVTVSQWVEKRTVDQELKSKHEHAQTAYYSHVNQKTDPVRSPAVYRIAQNK